MIKKEKLEKFLSPFKNILKEIILEAKKLKVKIYLVGGTVRDFLLGKSHYDLDIVVEGDAIELVKRVSRKLKIPFQKHHSFGTATLYFDNFKIDFATARKEYYPHWGSLPKVKPSSLKDDLLRRDFTINALAISLKEIDFGKIVDFYGGLKDLKKGQIRVLHKKSFLEDPTRILRAIRFEQRFSFCIEKNTFKLMKEAIEKKSLNWVHPHRLRDELILILKEPHPYRCIKRINGLMGFSFLHPKIKLEKDNFKLFLRIKKAILFYKKEFFMHRELEEWLLYLMGIVINLSKKSILKIMEKFGFKKGERIRVISAKENLFSIKKKLNKKVIPHKIYSLLNPLNFETIIFIYAYHKEKILRENIKFFLKKLNKVHLKIKGDDLKKIGIFPPLLYSKILKKVLYAKIDKNFHTKEEELEEAKKIFKRISKVK
jgi:tRNA nucleotidyltransferase (CCA-adding enzyme)